MNHKKTIATLTVMMMAFISLSIVTADDSDADIWMEDDGFKSYGFKNNSNGTLEIKFKSQEAADFDITITITDSNGKTLHKETVTVSPGLYIAHLSFNIGGVGEHEVTITCEPSYIFPGSIPLNVQTVTITVEESIWSKWTTYAAVAIIVILILIAVLIRMRGAPNVKPDTTFTELERQKESREEPEEDEAPRSSKRRRYEEGTTASVPVKKEQKAASFTELEKEKSAPKPAKEPVKEPVKKEKKKEESSEPPKKLKYVSSRRK
jgi:hypothetical protein